MIYKGIYHLFYQYNPTGAVPGNIVWAHSTSRDLINWTPHPPALSRDTPHDTNGCWSGSATLLPNGEPVLVYTGVNTENQQVQNLAIPKNPSDPNLIEWIKPPYNPVIAPTQQNMINATSFRDPTTAWLGRDGLWRLIVGNKIGQNGRMLMFMSRDFVHWFQSKNPLYSRRDTGMWECPDFYPVSTGGKDGVETSAAGRGVKHVLKASMNDGFFDTYAIGSYDVGRDVFVPERGSLRLDSDMRYDHGKFYASKTFYDGSVKRRVLWGWINESTDAATDISKGWSGLQADVEISFEISTLEKAEEMDPSLTDPQAICSYGAAGKGGVGPFGLLALASKDLQEYTAVYFRVFRDKTRYVVIMCSDQSRSSLSLDYDKPTYGAFVDVDPVKEKLSLRTLIDHSIVESFGGDGKACITARVYPSVAIDGGAHLFAFNNGTYDVKISKLAAWSMKAAQIN